MEEPWWISHLIETKWFDDPTHRAKYVAGIFFEMTKSGSKETKTSNLDALRMKKYYSYFIKQTVTHLSIYWLTPWLLLTTYLEIIIYVTPTGATANQLKIKRNNSNN